MIDIKPENRIYHYCSLDTALKYILPYNQLLLSPIQKTNDPRENKSFYFSHNNSDSSFLSESKNILKLNQELSESIRDGSKVLCFSQDYKSNWGCCLSKMWAHYGGNHQGICLGIDKAEFTKENLATYNFNRFKKINYFEYDPDNPPKHKEINHAIMKKFGREIYLKEQFREEHLDYLFFTKNSEWSSESEIRLLHFSDNLNNEYCSIKESLKYIFLGINFDNKYLTEIKDLIEGTEKKIANTYHDDIGLAFSNLLI